MRLYQLLIFMFYMGLMAWSVRVIPVSPIGQFTIFLYWMVIAAIVVLRKRQ